MPEVLGNVEIAQKLHEHGAKRRSGIEEGERLEAYLEIFEALMLALVAIATAWSGYQGARWDGRSAESYAEATGHRVEADEAATLGGQQRMYDVSTFNTWLQAKTMGSEKVAELLERRFSGEYQIAFKAWLQTDPLNNPSAPPGPIFMREYVNHREVEAVELNRQAAQALKAGSSFRETGEDYVRLTVFLATVLFLIAMSQRFRHKGGRLALLGIAVISIGIILYLLVTYPRA